MLNKGGGSFKIYDITVNPLAESVRGESRHSCGKDSVQIEKLLSKIIKISIDK